MLSAALGLVLLLVPSISQAAGPRPVPGAPGIGDRYYPLDGNGGYDVGHYDLDVAYDPPTDRLVGVATIRARATANLSSFNLDLVGLQVRSVTVGGRAARWSRDGQELTVVPGAGLAKGARFTTVVRYDGVPQSLKAGSLLTGFVHTDAGAVVAGQPHVAATWFPVNDHPSDPATYTVHVTAPKGLEVISNGLLTGQQQKGPRTRWTWQSDKPMASYLLMLAIGEYDIASSRVGGLRYVNAIDRRLFKPHVMPATGKAYLYSQRANSAYKRLSRVITVPAGGATVSFKVGRAAEGQSDFVFVEARTVGKDDWTTLPDTFGHTSQDTGFSCRRGWQSTHPFLARYQSVVDARTCSPTGTSGSWWAATGTSAGYENWSVDLARYAGSQVELSISYASDEDGQLAGVFVDDIAVSTGVGSTSFEADGDPLDGWTVAGPPAGSPGNSTDWTVTTAGGVTTTGQLATAALARQPEIIEFFSGVFGPYPFRSAGGLVVDDPKVSVGLETQTRPIYSAGYFEDLGTGNYAIAHELAHQWFGDDLVLRRWQDIWLNEGFATYANWLWDEHQGDSTPQARFEDLASFPEDSPFWDFVTGDPGPDDVLDPTVYFRGAATLHALRLEIGDRVFFELLRSWAAQQSGRTVTTAQFIALAEKLSGKDLDALFTAWLYTPRKPAGLAAPSGAAARGAAVTPATPERLARLFSDRAAS